MSWLSEIEKHLEEYAYKDITSFVGLRMARVIREQSEVIKAAEEWHDYNESAGVPIGNEERHFEYKYNNLSPDAKEVIDDLAYRD